MIMMAVVLSITRPIENNSKDSFITSRIFPFLKNISRKPSRPHDMGDRTDKVCIKSGMTNLGIIMPPRAPRMILKTPPMVVACSVVLATDATSRAKEMEQKLTAVVIKSNPP